MTAHGFLERQRILVVEDVWVKQRLSRHVLLKVRYRR
jgi:hypothetical protein